MKSDSFWADVWNLLLFRGVYRKPKRRSEPSGEELCSSCGVPVGFCRCQHS